MPTFEQLTVRNFLSHVDTTVDLANRGVVLVAGRVEGSAAVSSNGAGKTALLPDGITYALFGRTLRGARGKDVIRQQAGTDCYVELRLTADDGVPIRIRRVQDHQTIPKSHVIVGDETYVGAEEIDRVVQECLGIHYASFVSSLVIGKGDTKFFTELSDTGRKQILDDLLSLSELTTFYETTKAKLTDVETAYRECETAKARAESARDATGRLTQELQPRAERFSEWQARELMRLAQAVKENAHRVEMAECARNVAKTGAADCHENCVLLRETLTEKQDLVTAQRAIVSEVQTRLTELRTRRQFLEEAASRVSGLQGKCPTCLQDITLEHQTAVKVETDRQVEALAEQERRTQMLLTTESLALDAKEVAAREDYVTLRNVEGRLRELDMQTSHLEAQHSDATRQLSIVIAEQKRVGELRNEAAETLERIRAECVLQDAEIAKATTALQALETERALLEFWKIGFGNSGLRAWLIDGCVPFLNERAQHYGELLTDGMIGVQFSSQTPLKSGGVSEKFQVAVTVQEGGQSYTVCSDGQRRRADLITTMALGDLAAARVGHPLNIAILDEVFDGLDAVGMERAIQLLMHIAANRSSVFVISHAEGLQPYFPHVMTVVNRHGASCVE